MASKLVIVLLIALQACLCLSHLPEPDKELVEKYDKLKSSLYARIVYWFQKLLEVIQSLEKDSESAKKAKERLEELQEDPHFQSFVKIVTGLYQDVTPLVDKGRSAVLGLYGEHLRPHIGTHLDQAITHVQSMLDIIWPKEK
uniref:Apolipoprotein A-II n=1 Tax=Scleropages formosus TaxID=113540 RepID=A0A8C9SHE2_SCLFO